MSEPRRAFRVWRDPSGCWRWCCTHCSPPCHGARHGPEAWQRIMTISLPHHMRVRAQHHAWVGRFDRALARLQRQQDLYNGPVLQVTRWALDQHPQELRSAHDPS